MVVLGGYGGVGGMVVLRGMVVYSVGGNSTSSIHGIGRICDFVVCLYSCLGMLSTDHTSGSWATSIDQRFC